jgi:hypothetical protein
MQLYFYDTDETTAHRVKRSPKLDTSMIQLILSCRTTHMCFYSRISVRCLIFQSTKLNLIQAYLLIKGDIMHLGWIRSLLYGWKVMTLSRGFLAA